MVVHLLIVGALQLLANRFPVHIFGRARCWLRTSCGAVPPEFVTRTALVNIIQTNLLSFGKDWITLLIRRKQKTPGNTGENEEAA